MKHLGDELDFRRLVRILFGELETELKRAVVPVGALGPARHGFESRNRRRRAGEARAGAGKKGAPKDDGVPFQNIAILGRRTARRQETRRRVRWLRRITTTTTSLHLMPFGASVCSRLKSRSSRRLAGVDCRHSADVAANKRQTRADAQAPSTSAARKRNEIRSCAPRRTTAARSRVDTKETARKPPSNAQRRLLGVEPKAKKKGPTDVDRATRDFPLVDQRTQTNTRPRRAPIDSIRAANRFTRTKEKKQKRKKERTIL